MSLICDETGQNIRFGASLMSGTRSDVRFHSALCQKVISQIPDSEKRTEPCEPGVGGVDIHHSTSSRDFNGNYMLSDFRLGEFVFSVSDEIARRYLPVHYRRFQVYLLKEA